MSQLIWIFDFAAYSSAFWRILWSWYVRRIHCLIVSAELGSQESISLLIYASRVRNSSHSIIVKGTAPRANQRTNKSSKTCGSIIYSTYWSSGSWRRRLGPGWFAACSIAFSMAPCFRFLSANRGVSKVIPWIVLRWLVITRVPPDSRYRRGQCWHTHWIRPFESVYIVLGLGLGRYI
jgi:hypothetical protein